MLPYIYCFTLFLCDGAHLFVCLFVFVFWINFSGPEMSASTGAYKGLSVLDFAIVLKTMCWSK